MVSQNEKLHFSWGTIIETLQDVNKVKKAQAKHATF